MDTSLCRSTLTRFIACWLVVLIVAPFTAPFRVADVASFFGGTSARHGQDALPTVSSVSSYATVPIVPAAARRVRSTLFRVVSGDGDMSPASAGFTTAAAFAVNTQSRRLVITVLRL